MGTRRSSVGHFFPVPSIKQSQKSFRKLTRIQLTSRFLSPEWRLGSHLAANGLFKVVNLIFVHSFQRSLVVTCSCFSSQANPNCIAVGSVKDVEEVDISCLLSPEQVMWNDDELDHEMTDAQRRRFVKCKETNLDKMSIIMIAGLISRLL